ncbi:MAG: D-alanyl-D-alanine carboxypeptidase family protein [Alphaproteobacteria bacterium]
MNKLRFFLPVLLVLLAINQAYALTTKAKQAILIDAQTGTVLYEKNADQLMAPSSMTKIMLVYLAFEHMKRGELAWEDELPVSKLAWRKGGSRMFVEVGTKVPVSDLLRGIIVQSGNDASIVVAEHLAGNEAVFALEMTRRANAMGATNTTFKNSTGWPDPLHQTTARDLALITDSLIKDFPEYCNPIFSEREFTYNNISQPNRNPLLYKKIGCDVGKTGYTEAGGYGLAASSIDETGRRIVMVINGCKSKGERAREGEALMRWGFRNTITPKIFEKGQEVVNAHVWQGAENTVSLVLQEDLYITIPRRDRDKLKVEAKYLDPIPPMQAGKVVGKVVVSCEGHETIETPLVVAKEVEEAGFIERITGALSYLIFGDSYTT